MDERTRYIMETIEGRDIDDDPDFNAFRFRAHQDYKGLTLLGRKLSGLGCMDLSQEEHEEQAAELLVGTYINGGTVPTGWEHVPEVPTCGRAKYLYAQSMTAARIDRGRFAEAFAEIEDAEIRADMARRRAALESCR